MWIRISFDPTTGNLSSISNMSYGLEIFALEAVKLDVRDKMKQNAAPGRPTISRGALQPRRVDAS